MAELGKTTDLEEQFFLKENQKMAEKHRAMRQLKKTKEALVQVSGIQDDAVLEKLISLDIRPETLASVSIVPFVEVAWADGSIDGKEKDAILKVVSKFGWTQDSLNYEMLNQWLTQKPPASLLMAWKNYVQGLCNQMTSEEVAKFKKEIVEHATLVAEAAGGFLGFGKISSEERNVISQLESSFPSK